MTKKFLLGSKVLKITLKRNLINSCFTEKKLQFVKKDLLELTLTQFSLDYLEKLNTCLFLISKYQRELNFYSRKLISTELKLETSISLWICITIFFQLFYQ